MHEYEKQSHDERQTTNEDYVDDAMSNDGFKL